MFNWLVAENQIAGAHEHFDSLQQIARTKKDESIAAKCR
jgi:hypothetical protein